MHLACVPREPATALRAAAGHAMHGGHADAALRLIRGSLPSPLGVALKCRREAFRHLRDLGVAQHQHHMEGLGGYATSSSDEEDVSTAMSVTTASTCAAAAGPAAAAADAARAQRVVTMEKSGSDNSDDSDDDSSGSDSSDEEQAAELRRAASKAPAVALPSVSDLMSGGAGDAGGVFHNPYEQQDIHTKRKLDDNDDNTIFKKVQGKKKVYGQGQKPKTNSSVARSWYALPMCLTASALLGC